MKGLNKVLLAGCAVVSIACLDEIREIVNQKPTKEVIINDEVADLISVIEEIKNVGELVLVRENGSASINHHTCSENKWNCWFTDTETTININYNAHIGIDLNNVIIYSKDNKIVVIEPQNFDLIAFETFNKEIDSNYHFLSKYLSDDKQIELEELLIDNVKNNIITDEIKIKCMKSFEDNLNKIAESLNIEIVFY